MKEQYKPGFSLIELLVVVSVMAIIFGGVTVFWGEKVDRDLTFNAELNEAALRISSSIYREVWGREPGDVNELIDKGLLAAPADQGEKEIK